jgi:hypothetical protein
MQVLGGVRLAVSRSISASVKREAFPRRQPLLFIALLGLAGCATEGGMETAMPAETQKTATAAPAADDAQKPAKPMKVASMTAHAALPDNPSFCGIGAAIDWVPPADDVPPEMARFYGLWGEGMWDGLLCQAIAVSDVKPDGTAKVTSFTGTFHPWRFDRPRTHTYAATIAGNTLRYESYWTKGVWGEFTVNGNSIHGVWDGTYRVDLPRVASRASGEGRK